VFFFGRPGPNVDFFFFFSSLQWVFPVGTTRLVLQSFAFPFSGGCLFPRSTALLVSPGSSPRSTSFYLPPDELTMTYRDSAGEQIYFLDGFFSPLFPVSVEPSARLRSHFNDSVPRTLPFSNLENLESPSLFKGDRGVFPFCFLSLGAPGAGFSLFFKVMVQDRFLTVPCVHLPRRPCLRPGGLYNGSGQLSSTWTSLPLFTDPRLASFSTLVFDPSRCLLRNRNFRWKQRNTALTRPSAPVSNQGIPWNTGQVFRRDLGVFCFPTTVSVCAFLFLPLVVPISPPLVAREPQRFPLEPV